MKNFNTPDNQRKLLKRINQLKKRATKSELAFEKRLYEANIYYIFQKGFLTTSFCIADFYLPKPNRTVIEIDGGYHNTAKQQMRDKYKDEYYKKRGFKVIRIKDEDVLTFDLSQFIPCEQKLKPRYKKKWFGIRYDKQPYDEDRYLLLGF